MSNLDPSVGGTERVTISIAKKLSTIGYKVFFIYTSKDNISIPGEQKLYINYSNEIGSIKENVLSYLSQNKILLLVVVNRVFQTKKYQNIYSYIKQNSKIKIIASLHASPDNWVNKNKWGLVLPKVYFKEKIKSILLKFWNPHVRRVVGTYNVVDKYLLLSKSYFESFKHIYPIKDNGKKLIAIPNPFPFDDNVDCMNKENIVLIVSRMQEDQKRIYVALKIWNMVQRNNPNWKLVVVGNGPHLNDYKKIATDLHNVQFVGHSNCVQEFYKNSKIFLMTSIWEGLPMTLIEAMHYGCIPIAFDSFDAIHDIISNQYTGYIIPNNDINKFTERLNFIMNNPKVIDDMSQRIMSQTNKFEINEIIKIWNNEIHKICQS